MNALNMARTAYSAPETPTRTGRGLEYEVFARITRRLKTAAATEAQAGFGALIHALYDNRRLWTILAADVADPANRLPDPLKARILYLNDFTQIHSRKVLSGKASADVLIDINTAVMRGLRSEPGVVPAGEAPQ